MKIGASSTGRACSCRSRWGQQPCEASERRWRSCAANSHDALWNRIDGRRHCAQNHAVLIRMFGYDLVAIHVRDGKASSGRARIADRPASASLPVDASATTASSSVRGLTRPVARWRGLVRLLACGPGFDFGFGMVERVTTESATGERRHLMKARRSGRGS